MRIPGRPGPLVIAILLTMIPMLIPRDGESAPKYDLVIENGRVMDPESGLDAIRQIGISKGKIQNISQKTLFGQKTIDASGLVVAPGFIDLHEHGQEPGNYGFQARDGVTTSLELELGTDNVDEWYAHRENKSLINFGVSAGHVPIRKKVMKDPGKFLPSADAAYREASTQELEAIKTAVEEGLKRGGLAVGMALSYTPAASHKEILELFSIAAKYQAPVDVHLRSSGTKEPKNGLSGLKEVIAAAAATGASLHVAHVTSMGLGDTRNLLAEMEGARKRGIDVSTEAYPYEAGSTDIKSPMFDNGWQDAMGITYKDLQWVANGERLTSETFDKYRKTGGIVVIHFIPEAVVRLGISDPNVMIASDGMPTDGPFVHPRGQGTFARIIGHYVRVEKVLNLMGALRKMTLMPARRLEKRVGAFKSKGRIRVGADADITIFSPERITDRATYEKPLAYSDGIPFVLVNGVPVVWDGKLVEAEKPGRAVRATKVDLPE